MRVWLFVVGAFCLTGCLANSNGGSGTNEDESQASLQKSWRSHTFALGNNIDAVLALSFSPDGRSLAIVGKKNVRKEMYWFGQLQLWDVNTLKRRAILDDPKSGTYFGGAIAFTPDSKAAITSHGGVLTWWNSQTAQRQRGIKIGDFAFSRTAYINLSFKGSTSLRDIRAGNLIRELPPLSASDIRSKSSLAVSPDTKMFAIGYAGDAMGKVELRDGFTAKLIHTLRGHQCPVVALIFSPDGKTLASASNPSVVPVWTANDYTVRLWNTATGKLLRTLQVSTGENCIAFSPDSKTLATGSTDKTIKLWNVTTGQLQRVLSGYKAPVSSIAYSPNGSTLAGGAGDKVTIWHTRK